MSDMLKSILLFIIRIYKKRFNLFCIITAIIVLGVDFITGRHIEFPILYVIPVWMATGGERKIIPLMLAVLLPLIRIFFYYLWDEMQFISYAIINSSITMAALIFYSHLIGQVLHHKKELEEKVNALEGILPICASCKKIRNENGEYEQIEKYIAEHSRATFTHGLCPECAKKLYPRHFK